MSSRRWELQARPDRPLHQIKFAECFVRRKMTAATLFGVEQVLKNQGQLL